MIKQIDIANFGSFSNFIWRDSVRDPGNNIQSFKRLNILYGRNYSGKTTLSRIFRALQTSQIPLNYTNPTFKISSDNGEISQTTITNQNYDIRVYNSDFVADNLGFLVDQNDGEIQTFAIVGEENKETEEAITAIEAQLGSSELQTGLKFGLDEKREQKESSAEASKAAKDSLLKKLRKHANENIKKNREYGPAVYNIDNIKKDIEHIKSSGFVALSSEEQAINSSLLKQEVLPEIPSEISINLKANDLRSTANSLLQKVIKPSQPIQELLNDSILQAWVKSGIPLHRDSRDTCAFCRQPLPHDLWKVIDSHFSKEVDDLESDIETCITSINEEISNIPSFITHTPEQFYAAERDRFNSVKGELDGDLETYKQDLEAIKSALEVRKADIFKVVPAPEVKHRQDSIEQHLKVIKELIASSNSRSLTLDNDKEAARTSLRLSDVSNFISVIDYDNEQTSIAALEAEALTAETVFTEAESQISNLESQIEALRAMQKDERKGAERVNELLNHFFGHDGIKLEAKTRPDETAIRFEITRDGRSAYNLSEGECSLIAFCYFMAKLEEPESKDKELIIYIDDPISSLDGNHIFFMFSLIESLIAKPIKNDDGSNRYRYKQLFISTHNLDFLKYLKKLSWPNEKNHGGCQHFMISRANQHSNITLMPDYLKNYVTEFNYLFHQIHKCHDPLLAETNHEAFYSFGNNLRKFLEAFLFYKYPYHDDKNDSLERIGKFFGDDDTAIALANRLNNELSHLESIFDRSVRPIDIPEISRLATYVLDKIYTSDPDQYNALLKSIGEPERTT